MLLIFQMGTLIRNAIILHNDNPNTHTKPTYPEAYEFSDATAPNGKHIINVREAIKTIVQEIQNCDSYSGEELEERYEYWQTLGIYISVLWKQQWIQDMFSKRRGLFHLCQM